MLINIEKNKKNKTMSRKATKVPLSITKENAFVGERGGAIELFNDGTTFFPNDVEDILDLTRMKSGVINDENINAMMKETTDLLNKKILRSSQNNVYKILEPLD